MSWLNLNESLNSLKGQITNFASEVLAEGSTSNEDPGDHVTDLAEAELQLEELTKRCHQQEEEVCALRRLNAELQSSLQQQQHQHQQQLQPGRGSVRNGDLKEDEPWFWDPPETSHKNEAHEDTEREMQELHKQISELKLKLDAKDEKKEDKNLDEIKRLKEENANLASSLEDLDQQHQQAMARLLTLKKDLQKNFEIMKKEHEEVKSVKHQQESEIEILKKIVWEKDEELKNVRITAKEEYETLHHKYVNLERVHNVLQENAEKFQEENQELHEEVFKLQEELAKYDHGDEVPGKYKESEMIPREKYEELLKELMQMQETKCNERSMQLDDTNIDDNAKSVIKNLKNDISDLKRRLASASAGDTEKSVHVTRGVNSEKLVNLYNKYVNFDLPPQHVTDFNAINESNLTEKYEDVVKTLNAFKKELDILTTELAQEKTRARTLQSQLDQVMSENEFLNADLTQSEGELSEMKKNNDFLLSEITALKNTSKLQPIIETHEDNIVKLETELADCNKINKTFEQEINTIQKNLCEVINEKVTLQKDLNDLRTKYNEMLVELDSYKSQFEVARKFELGSQAHVHAQLQEAQGHIDELKRKNCAAATKHQQLSIDHSIAQNEVVILTQKIDELKKQLEEREMKAKKITILENKLDDLEKHVSEVTKLKKEIELDRQLMIEKIRSLATETDSLDQIERYQSIFENSTQEVDQHLAQILTRLLQLKHVESELNSKIQISKFELEIADLKSQLSQHEAHSKEVEYLKENNRDLQQTHMQLQHHAASLRDNLTSSNSEIEKLAQKLKSKEEEITDLKRNLDAAKTNENAYLEKQIEALNNNLQSFMTEDQTMATGIESLKSKLLVMNSRINQYERDIKNLKTKCTEREKEIYDLNEEKQNLLALHLKLERDLKTALDEISIRDSQTTKQEEELKELLNEMDLLRLSIASRDENTNILNETIDNLKNTLNIKDAEILRLQSEKLKSATPEQNAVSIETYNAAVNERESLSKRVRELEEKLQMQGDESNEIKLELEGIQKALEDNIASLERLQTEKNELINFITVKHNENIQYHAEIQRLNNVILQHIEEKKILEEKHEQLKKEIDKCAECVKLRIILKDKDEKLMAMDSRLSETAKRELSNATDTIRNLTEKCEELDRNLTIQQDLVKNLTAEKVELAERQRASDRQLERLRAHLAEIEDAHAQELMAAERSASEARAQLAAAQQHVHNTASNVRTQQELETLRAQLRLVEKRREQDAAALAQARAEAERSQQAADTLQRATEQMQCEKDREVETATLRVRQREQELLRVNESLRAELRALESRLEESRAGLEAGARLGSQLESDRGRLHEARKQVEALQAALRAAEERHAAASRQHERVDKGLVKNLLLNYLQAQDKRDADKLQVLRILSTVLDFNQQESERVGLARAAHAHTSLAREFVSFLEKESRPSALPPMLGLGQSAAQSRSSTPQSRKNSTLGPPTPLDLAAAFSAAAPGHKRSTSSGSSNALLDHLESPHGAPEDSQPSLMLQQAGINQTRNTEGAILKNVLKDL